MVLLLLGMRISRSGFAKRASTWEVWMFVPGPPIARFLVGRLEREEIEVGMLSGMFSDIVGRRSVCVAERREWYRCGRVDELYRSR